MITDLGPLVLMLIKMVTDVAKLLVLDFFVLTAVASGMYILFNAYADGSQVCAHSIPQGEGRAARHSAANRIRAATALRTAVSAGLRVPSD